MSYQFIHCEIEHKVAVVTINRPPVNPLSREVFQELQQAFTELDNNEEVAAIVLTGDGEKAFVAGADINEMVSADLVDIMENSKISRSAFSTIENITKPVIASINGLALGGGLELALCCDLRISSSKAKFAFPEVGLGIIPGGGGTQRLQRIVGQGIAKELIYFGDMINADRAAELQIINRVVEPEKVLIVAKEWAEKLAEKPVVALRMVKTAINTGANVDLESGLTIENNCFSNAFVSEDAKEGLSAFTEKREPQFTGK